MPEARERKKGKEVEKRLKGKMEEGKRKEEEREKGSRKEPRRRRGKKALRKCLGIFLWSVPCSLPQNT